MVLSVRLLIMNLAPVEVGDYYRDKTVRIVVGFAPGGGLDTYSRTIARHLGRHIPGSPNLIVSNLPRAGSVIAANQLYHRTPSDGLTIGNFLGSLTLSQMLSAQGIEFDARRFAWLGSIAFTCPIESIFPSCFDRLPLPAATRHLSAFNRQPCVGGALAPGNNLQRQADNVLHYFAII